MNVLPQESALPQGQAMTSFTLAFVNLALPLVAFI
jgi:hypothetical protein